MYRTESIPQASLADEYVRLLECSTHIHYAFAPAHHVTQSSTSTTPRRFVYMVTSKDVSYSDIRSSPPFSPVGPSGVANPAYKFNVPLKLPQSYTRQWTKWRLPKPIRPGSLATLRLAGDYNKSLAYVIGASLDPYNECAVVAVVPRLSYPPAKPVPSSLDFGGLPPTKKQKSLLASTAQGHTSKGKHTARPRPRLGLFAAHLLESVTTHWSPGGDLGLFFSRRFKPATLRTSSRHGKSTQATASMDFSDFEWSVRRTGPEPWDFPEDRQLPPTDNGRPQRYNDHNKQLPVREYKGHYYYCGMRIIPVYRQRELDRSHTFDIQEILPFVESRIEPNFFDPFLSFLHWKTGDKVIRKTPQDHFCFHVIKEVLTEKHSFVGDLVTLPKVNGPQTQATTPELEDTRSLENPLDARKFRLMLRPFDHVAVIAGVHKNRKGTIILVEDDTDTASIEPYDSHHQVRHFPLVSALSDKILQFVVPLYWLQTDDGPDRNVVAHSALPPSYSHLPALLPPPPSEARLISPGREVLVTVGAHEGAKGLVQSLLDDRAYVRIEGGSSVSCHWHKPPCLSNIYLRSSYVYLF